MITSKHIIIHPKGHLLLYMMYMTGSTMLDHLLKKYHMGMEILTIMTMETTTLLTLLLTMTFILNHHPTLQLQKISPHFNLNHH